MQFSPIVQFGQIIGICVGYELVLLMVIFSDIDEQIDIPGKIAENIKQVFLLYLEDLIF